MTVLYAQTSGTLQTNAGNFTPIPGLTVSLPEGVDLIGLIVLNVPNPYATGNNYPGGQFALNINGAISPVQAAFTYNEQQPSSSGRVPTTLVVGVPLNTKPQVVQAMWAGVRGSTVIIDTPATLSAFID